MLTPYQFASNSPSFAIDLDGLEAWIVITEKYGESDPISNMVFVDDVRIMGGVYEVHKNYDENNNLINLRGNFENYSSYPQEFPRQGNYNRQDGKPVGLAVEMYAAGMYVEVGVEITDIISIELGAEGRFTDLSFNTNDGFDGGLLNKVGEHIGAAAFK